MKSNLKVLIIIIFLTQSSCLSDNFKFLDQHTDPEIDSLVKSYLDSRPSSYLIRMQEWQQYMDSAINLQPNNAYLWQQKAMPYFKARKYSLGMKYLKKAVELDRDRYLSYQAFIKCIFIKDYESAIEDLSELVIKDSNGYVQDHTYYFYLGISFLQLDRFEEASANLEQSIRIQKDEMSDDWIHFLDYFYLGVAYFELDQYESVIIELDKCLDSYPQFSEALMYKAWSYYYLNQPDSANHFYEMSIEFSEQGYTINEQNALYEKYPYQNQCL